LAVSSLLKTPKSRFLFLFLKEKKKSLLAFPLDLFSIIYWKMSLSGNGQSMMEALHALVLKERGETEDVKPVESNPVVPGFDASSFGLFLDDENDCGEEDGNMSKKYGSVLKEPCNMSFHEQYVALRLSDETGHLRSQGMKSPHMAAMLGRSDVFWWLVNHDEDYLSRTHAGNSVFHIAAEYGREDLVRSIFERFGGTVAPYDKRVNEKSTNEAKQTALHLAAGHGHLSIVKYLIEKAKLSIRDRDHEMYTPLMVAAQRGHFEIVKYLHTKRGASLSETGQYKYTALLLASISGHFNVVKYIMKHGGSNKEVTNLVNTALHVASMGGHCEIVQHLLDKYPQQFNVNMKNSNGQTPLHLAVWAGHDPLTSLLVTKYQSSLTHTNAKGNTPLLMACLRGHVNVAKTLISLGSQFNEINRNGNTPILLAAYGGHNDVIQWLLQPETNSGLTINDRSNSGNSAILHASSQALLHTVQFLLEHCGANINDANNSGRTVFELASSFAPVKHFLEDARQRIALQATKPSTTSESQSSTSTTSTTSTNK
jgi:ankyrin repeat protein